MCLLIASLFMFGAISETRIWLTTIPILLMFHQHFTAKQLMHNTELYRLRCELAHQLSNLHNN